MKKTKMISSAVLASLLLAGCGSDSSTPTTNVAENTSEIEIGTGYYVDSAIAGVQYVCGTQVGTTNKQGMFKFEKNEDCTFKIGDVTLREVNASVLKDKVTILEDDAKTARFLQVLDVDGNASNGIEVSSSSKDLDLTEVPTEEAVLASIHTDLKAKDDAYEGRVVSSSEAQRHVESTREEIKNDNRETQYTQDENRENNNSGSMNHENNASAGQDHAGQGTENNNSSSMNNENNTSTEQEHTGQGNSNNGSMSDSNNASNSSGSNIGYLKSNHTNYSQHGSASMMPTPTKDAAAKSINWAITATTTEGATKLASHIEFMIAKLAEGKNPRGWDKLFLMEAYMKVNHKYTTQVELSGTDVIVSKNALTTCAYEVISAHSDAVSGDFFARGDIEVDYSTIAESIISSDACSEEKVAIEAYIVANQEAKQ